MRMLIPMRQIPAKCGNCGYLFPSGYGVDPGVTGVEVSMKGWESAPVSTPCPMCGRRRGRVLAGEFEFVKDTMKFLSGPESTVKELERLVAFLREAQERGASADEILTTVDAEEPTLSPIIRKLLADRPARMELAAWLSILIAILTALWTNSREEPEPSQVIYNTNNYNVTVQTPPADRVGKVGRNAPCPCGSGKKFKKCHGGPTGGAEAP